MVADISFMLRVSCVGSAWDVLHCWRHIIALVAKGCIHVFFAAMLAACCTFQLCIR